MSEKLITINLRTSLIYLIDSERRKRQVDLWNINPEHKNAQDAKHFVQQANRSTSSPPPDTL